MRAIYSLKVLLAAACILTGCLAGGNIDRYFVQLPAWRYVDILSWAEYSRHADLGNGLWLYPVEAAGGFFLLLISSIIAINKRRLVKQTALIVHLATIFAAIKLVITSFASPVILRVKTMGNNRELLQRAFDNFHFWSPYNVIVQILCFVFCIWAMGRLFALSSTIVKTQNSFG